jgi:H+/Cl- antiporter ClcA
MAFPAFLEPFGRWCRRDLVAFLKWILLSLPVGSIVGVVGALFAHGLTWVTQFREAHFWMLYLLPAAGLAIVGIYHLLDMDNDGGTEFILASVRDARHLHFRMLPLIFVSTLLTHLTGGSAGREGAALQIGGSIGHNLGRLLRLDDRDERVITMAGMAAGFSALFGTPIGAAVFAMEVVSVGVMYYSAIVPCFLSALIAKLVARWLGVPAAAFVLQGPPDLTPLSLVQLLGLGALCALAAVLFCQGMRLTGIYYGKLTQNRWIRVLLGGVLVVALTLLLGTTDYNGAGMDVLTRAVEGRAVPVAFLLKILFTAITLRAGYKGGEIVPTFFVGATFGCVVGPLLGLNPSFAAAAGMVAVFCGVTNCPLTSLLLGYELFAGAGLAPMALTIATSYMLSGYCGLYHEQLIMFSKTKSLFIHQNAGEEYTRETLD